MSKKWQAKIKYMNPKELIPYVKNSKIHTKDQINKLANAISKFGFTQPIVVDEKLVIGTGHGRREAAIALDMKEVPVIIADHLTEDEFMAMRIADNKLAESPWDEDILQFELQTLKLHDFNLDVIGFEKSQIDEFLNTGELKDEYFNNINYDGNKEIQDTAPVENKSKNIDDEDIYTKKIKSPIYEPKGEKPKIEELFDFNKTNELIKQIESSNISQKDKEFLKFAAYRHIVFNYQNIAEYYAHADKPTQELMENSALVIIDYNKAIENGFVKLSEELENMYKHENMEEE